MKSWLAHRSSLVMVCSAALLCGLLLLMSLGRLQRANAARGAIESRLSHVRSEGRAVLELRQQTQTIALGERPEGDVIALIHAALANAGLPERHLAGVRNESDTAIPSSGAGPEYRRQSLAINLRDIGSADLGRFLTAWRAAQPFWKVTRLSLTHPRQMSGQQDPGAFDVTLAITSLYLGVETE